MAGDRDKAIEAGMNDHVPKPFDDAQPVHPPKPFTTLLERGSSIVTVTSGSHLHHWMSRGYTIKYTLEGRITRTGTSSLR